MGASKVFVLMLAASAAASAGSWQARAQCRLCDAPTTSRAQENATSGVRLEIETSLNFDRLVLSAAGGGSALLRPDGSSTVDGSLSSLSGRAIVGSAVIHGEPGRAVRVELPQRIELYSIGGGRITFDQVVSDLPSVPRLDSAGNLSFRFGGRVRIEGDAEGDYRGDLPVTVEYL